MRRWEPGTGLAGALMPLAEVGVPRAQAWVAYLLGAGSGGSCDLRVQHNLQRSARWYAKAAEQGCRARCTTMA